MSPRFNRKTSTWSAVNLKKHVTSMSYKLESAIWSRDTGQRIPWFDRCQLVIARMSNIKEVPKYTVNQGCMSGRHLGQLRRRHRRRRAYAPTSNTASHDNYEKINPWVSFSFLYEYGASLGGPWGRRSSAKKTRTCMRGFLVNLIIEKENETKISLSPI